MNVLIVTGTTLVVVVVVVEVYPSTTVIDAGVSSPPALVSTNVDVRSFPR